MGAIGIMPVLVAMRIVKYYGTTVSRGIRKLLGLSEKDHIEWVFENGKIIFREIHYFSR